MNDLIKITPDGKITARELYDFLQLNPAHWSRWAKTNIEQDSYYEENKDWQGFTIMVNGNETKDYSLTIDFAKHLCMLSRSERGKQARSYFVEVENRHSTQQKQLAATDPLDLIIAQATLMKEIRQKQEAQDVEIKTLAAKIETRPIEHFTIAGYANIRGLRIETIRAAKLGKMAAELSKECGYDTGKTHDPRFGQVGTYHTDILAEVFKREGF